MSVELKHKSVYFGLLVSQLLAVACNVFLDIEYGHFAFEMFFWTCLYAYSIFVAVKQNGVMSEYGSIRMRRLLIFGAILSALIIIPTWGFPRAFIYILAILQVAYNCTTTSRRQLYMGILMSLVIVIFASSHYRADWTMLFYLIPYIIFVVFTIVAEQINSKSDELRTSSLSVPMLAGQSVAILSATLSILLVGFLLYLITPQTNIERLKQGMGNPTAIGPSPRKIDSLKSNQPQPANNPSGFFTNLLSNWPSSNQMRMAAMRTGMPEWQANAINTLADLSDYLSVKLKPTLKSIDDLWDAFKKWLTENALEIIQSISLLVLLCLMIALIILMRESAVANWIRTRIDYLSLGIFQVHGNHEHAISKYYFAIERLLDLQHLKRNSHITVKEHFDEISIYNYDTKGELKMIVRYFEDYRYGEKSVDKNKLALVNSVYKKIYRSLSK